MRVLAIADPHLSKRDPKPMDVFGPGWAGHPEAFFEGWRATVRDDDLVLVPGDVSWAMRLEDARADLEEIAALPGEKVLLRGNHDYWWPSLAKLRAALPARMHAVQNDAIRFGSVVVAGTRGWTPPAPGVTEQDRKIHRREVERLRLSLAAARRLGWRPGGEGSDEGERAGGERLVVMLHYPPAGPRLESNDLLSLLRDARPDVVAFGHVHGEGPGLPVPEIGDAEVAFVAADALGFRPRVLLDLPGETLEPVVPS